MMITIALKDNRYWVDYASGRALRGIPAAESVIQQIGNSTEPANEQLDEATGWLCTLFNNQFSKKDLHESCSVDELLENIIIVYCGVLEEAGKVFKSDNTSGGAGSASLWEIIMNLYGQLLKKGWRMQDIDSCDLLGYVQVVKYISKYEDAGRAIK